MSEEIPPARKNEKKSKNKPKPKSTTEKDLANLLLDPTAKPVPLNEVFGGFTPFRHGNCEVDVDLNLCERFLLGMTNQIHSAVALANLYGYSQEEVVRLTGVGLNLGLAMKLLHSAPASELDEFDEFQVFDKVSLEMPSSFLPVLDLIGKTDHDDIVIRIKDNPVQFRTSLLKAIYHATKVSKFYDYLGVDAATRGQIRSLSNLSDVQLDTVIFPMRGQVRKIKDYGRNHLDDLLKHRQSISIGEDEEIEVSPPYLARDATKNDVINWANNLSDVFTNHDVLLLASLLTLCDISWLKRENDHLGVIDPAFIGSVYETLTPRQALAASGLHSIYEFFPVEGLFREVALNTFRFWTENGQVMSTLFKMEKMAKNSFGDPSQLVLLPRDALVPFEHPYYENKFATRVPGNAADRLTCSRKLSQPDKILLAGVLGITSKVRYFSNFKGAVNVSMREILSRLTKQSFLRK